MRVVVIHQPTDLHTLRTTLFTGTQPAAAKAAALERLKALNPHVDLQHVAAGTVLLLPDLPSVNPAGSRSIGGDAFAGLASEATSGLREAAQHVRAAEENLATERSAVAAALRTAAVKRIVASDATLAKQVEAAAARFTSEQKQVQEAGRTLEMLRTQVSEELATLGKLLG